MSDSSEFPERKAEKPWMSSGPSMYRSLAERLPMDLCSYSREAGHCLRERRFLASITMASTAVELILNRDRRTKALPELRRISGWATLNNFNLRTARANGLPTDTLISAGDELDGNMPIAFVELRNKLAHGEITHFITDLSDYDLAAQEAASVQEEKMRLFVSTWFNTAPDVQDGHIRNNHWPGS